MERKKARYLKGLALCMLLGIFPLLGGCGGEEKVPDNMILTHKTVQAAQSDAPEEVKPVPVEPSILSKGMEISSIHILK